MSLFNLTGNACQAPAPGGLAVDIYYTCTCELTNGMPQTKAQITPSGATPAHAKEYGEAFDFSGAAAGSGYWRRARCIVDENQLRNVIEGSKQGVSVAEMLTVKIPGFTPDSNALVDAFRNLSGCLLFAVKVKQGKMAIVGSTDYPVFVEPGEGGTGLVSSDVPGHVLNFRADSGLTSMFYDADVLALKTTPNA